MGYVKAAFSNGFGKIGHSNVERFEPCGSQAAVSYEVGYFSGNGCGGFFPHNASCSLCGGTDSIEIVQFKNQALSA